MLGIAVINPESQADMFVTIANCFLCMFSNHRETWTTVDTFQFKLLAVL